VDQADISKKLIKHKGVRISETELRDYLPYSDYDEYCEAVNSLVDIGAITPVRSSGSNGMNPPLYKRYSINKPRPDYEGLVHRSVCCMAALILRDILPTRINMPDKNTGCRCWIRS
jgi:hypothetical protein